MDRAPLQHRKAAVWPEKIALCLSGGGFRAALFHLGAVRRLNELGLLARLDAISSVSGGSILSAHLATTLRPWPTAPLSIEEFNERVAAPFESLCATNIRTGPVLRRLLLPWNWFRPDAAVRALARTYAQRLTDLRLGDLDRGPRFILCATDMIFGVNWIFDTADPHADQPRSRMGDYQTGYRPAADILLAQAVAASSCFPPVFNPMEMHLNPDEFRDGLCSLPNRDELVEGVSLSDGGVYDNLASQPVIERYGTLLVSDGGAVFEEIGPIGRFALIKRLKRYSSIAQHGGGAMRRQVIVGMFEDHDRRGTFWGIGTPPTRYTRRDPSCYTDELVDTVIEQVRTDLDAFSPAERAVLQNHGYLQADAAARTYLVASLGELLPDPLPASTPPYPDWLDPAQVRAGLATSNKRKLPFGRA